MKVIKSTTITEAILTATDVPETDEAEWSSATTYADGALVMVTGTGGGAASATHEIYESQQGSNTGNDPTIDDGTYWTRVSSTNRWKMFNDIVQEQTEQASGLEVELTPAAVTTALAAVNVDCADIDVVMVDPVEGTVFSQNYPMTSYSGITNWYDYFFEAIVRKNELAVIGLPPYSSATITVTFNDSGTAKVGALVIGTAATIGDSQYGASFGIIDYSTKSVDAQGRTTITAGTYADEADIDVIIETNRFAQVKSVLTDLRTTPSVWVPDENTDGTIIYGYYREFDVILSGPVVSLCSIQIEGLT